LPQRESLAFERQLGGERLRGDGQAALNLGLGDLLLQRQHRSL